MKGGCWKREGWRTYCTTNCVASHDAFFLRKSGHYRDFARIAHYLWKSVDEMFSSLIFLTPAVSNASTEHTDTTRCALGVALSSHSLSSRQTQQSSVLLLYRKGKLLLWCQYDTSYYTKIWTHAVLLLFLMFFPALSWASECTRILWRSTPSQLWSQCSQNVKTVQKTIVLLIRYQIQNAVPHQAVELTLKADDGQSPWLLSDADVIIVGVSPTGKTPLRVVLPQTMGLKVANIPLVLECPPPKELFDESIDSEWVFCLTIAPSGFKKIRTSRLQRINVKQMEAKYEFGPQQKSNYADRDYLLEGFATRTRACPPKDWTEIDVTGRAVEETAGYISELMNERFEAEVCL